MHWTRLAPNRQDGRPIRRSAHYTTPRRHTALKRGAVTRVSRAAPTVGAMSPAQTDADRRAVIEALRLLAKLERAARRHPAGGWSIGTRRRH